MSDKLKQFDKNAICQKCGCDVVNAYFCEKPRPVQKCWPAIKTGEGNYRGEHIHRYCTRCHYEWIELPLDKEVER